MIWDAANDFDNAAGFSGHASTETEADLIDIADLSVADLLHLRRRIDLLLPASSLKDMNLMSEAVVNYQKLNLLQDEVLQDKSAAPNQKAQVANACVAALAQLDRIQKESYTSERFKQLENILIKLLQDVQQRLGDQAVSEFMAQYQERVGAL